MLQRLHDLLPAPVDSALSERAVGEPVAFTADVQVREKLLIYDGAAEQSYFLQGTDSLYLKDHNGNPGWSFSEGSTAATTFGRLYGRWALAMDATAYTAFATSDNTALIRKDYLVSYVTGRLSGYPTTAAMNSAISAALLTYRNRNYYGYLTQLLDVDSGQPRTTNLNITSGAGGSYYCTTPHLFKSGDRFVLLSLGNGTVARGECTSGTNSSSSSIGLTFDTTMGSVPGPFVVTLDPTFVATPNTAGIVKICSPGNAIEGNTDQAVINSNTLTIRLQAFKAAAQTFLALATFSGGLKTPVATAAIKSAVSGGTYTSGELQGTQPAGSLPSMRFCDGNFLYQFTNGMNDTDGTSFVWVRTPKM